MQQGHHLTIWLGLVEWSPFDSIWSIWSIWLTCFIASQLKQQDTIWPFDEVSGMESIRLHLIDLIHSTHLLYSLSADATRCHLTILPRLVEWSSIRLHLIDMIHLTHLPYSLSA